MCRELQFNKTKEDINEFMTRATEIIRSMKAGVKTAEGVDYSEILSKEEQKEFWDYVIEIAIGEMERTVGKQLLCQHQFGSDSEGLISNFKIVILKNLDKFNDGNHLLERDKKYCFSTFLKHLASEAIRMTFADMHGVTVNIEKKFTLVRTVMRQIATEEQIAVTAVTPEMIHKARPSLTIHDITSVIHYLKRNISFEQIMEESGVEKEVFKEAEDLESNVFDVLDYDVEKLLNVFMERLSDVEKFFVLIEVGGCDVEYFNKTAYELAIDDILVNIVASDERFKKNLMIGNLKIERPGRSSAMGNTSIELKNVEFVSGNLIRYQRPKASKLLQKLNENLKMEDLAGSCGVEFFRREWEVLVERYI